MKKFRKFIAAGLTLTLLLPTFIGCASTSEADGKIKAANLMEDITASPTALTREPDNAFKVAYMNWSVELLKRSAALEQEGNLLLSPLSAMLVLAMTENGAKGETLEQMQALLNGELSTEELNATLYQWVSTMEARLNTSLSSANSIWTKKGSWTPKSDYLQTLADYYAADLYATPFNNRTVKDVNQWVKENTKDQIDSILEEIDPNLVMLLLNTLYFEAEWSKHYKDSQIISGTFHGTEKDVSVSMMHSNESTYLSMEGAQGFSKSYQEGYSFVALLPDEDIPIDRFVASLTSEQLLTALTNSSHAEISAQLPAFTYDCSLRLNEVLEPLIPSAFSDKADFSGMGEFDSPLYISEILQKTTISVNQNGTTAAAATRADLNFLCKEPSLPHYDIILDRPFVYAIIDNTTGLPIFIGVVEQL